MDDLDKQVEQNSIDILHSKVQALEKRVDDLKPSKSVFNRLKDLSSMITPVMVAFIGLWVTCNITGAIEKEKLELSHLNAMRDLMVGLSKPGTTKPEAEASAVSLAAFGSAAVAPLIHELQSEGDVRPLAAKEGLRAVAFRHAEETCELLTQALDSQGRLFNWRAHEHIIMLMGDIGCDDAIPTLKAFQQMLEAPGGLEEYKKKVLLDPEPNNKSVLSLKDALNAALVRLGSGED